MIQKQDYSASILSSETYNISHTLLKQIDVNLINWECHYKNKLNRIKLGIFDFELHFFFYVVKIIEVLVVFC